MELAGLQLQQDVMAPLRERPYHQWTAYGPAAGRAAVPFTRLQTWPRIRPLSFLASFPDADSLVLGQTADRWLQRDAEQLISTARLTAISGAFDFGGGIFRPTVPDPAKSPWRDPNFGEVLGNEDEQGFHLQRYLTTAGFDPFPMSVYPAGGAKLAADVFAADTRYATLAMQAESENPGPSVLQLPPILPDQFKGAAGVLGAGFAGAVAGSLARGFGASALASVGVGGLIGAGALWFLADRLPRVDLRPVWDLFTETFGTVTNTVLDWLRPGDPLPPREPNEGGTAAQQLGFAVTAPQPAIIDRFIDAAWSIFD